MKRVAYITDHRHERDGGENWMSIASDKTCDTLVGDVDSREGVKCVKSEGTWALSTLATQFFL